MNDAVIRHIARYDDGIRSTETQVLIAEEPLSIRIEGNPYAVVMRTPGNEIAHAAGFCLAEGIVDLPEDIITIGFCDEEETNVATITLTAARREKVAGILARKGFISQSSCGICGKEVVRDLRQIITPIPENTRFTAEKILACGNGLPHFQALHQKTRSAHAAVVLDGTMTALAHAEDVGRHNALDKAIGRVFMAGDIEKAVCALMSSRLSYELVQKAARAGIELMVGISRPTALAVELAESANMTLVWARENRLMVFCGEQRIVSSA